MDCIKVALEKVIGVTLRLPPNQNRGYEPTEVALALLEHGYAMTMYECVIGVELPQNPLDTMDAVLRKKYVRWRKKIRKDVHVNLSFSKINTIDLAPMDNCMVEIPHHAVSYIDGEFWDGDTKIEKPEKILSYWVPTRIKSEK